MSKTLVLFYSYEGSTRRLAHYIAENMDADLQEIKPVKEIKSKIVAFVWGGMQVMLKRKPKLMPLDVNLDEYDTIILGTPTWASCFAPSIRTLLDDGYLKNKKIGIYYCYDGGAGKIEKKSRAAIEKANIFLSTYSCLKVTRNFDSLKGPVLQWAKETVSLAG